jgi:5-formyltetrahydrofolate cyclo-ligase
LASFVSPIDPSGSRSKPSTRLAALSRRDAMPIGARTAASTAIAQRAHELIAGLIGQPIPEGKPPANVALYFAKGSEVDTSELAAIVVQAGGRVSYPRIVDDTRVLEFRAAAAHELIAGRYGLREPGDDAPIVELDRIDVVIVPGLAFDRAGARIGWGRGHYDATLAAASRALRIGLAFECQLVEHLPLEVHDVRLHAVISERATYQVSS